MNSRQGRKASKAAWWQKALDQARERGLILDVPGVRPVRPGEVVEPIATGAGDKARRMNRTEQRMAQQLEARRKAGEIVSWGFERFTILLDEQGITGGKGCRYRPDFDVLHIDGSIEFVEVKGARVEEDARLKFRWAQQAYPQFGWTWAQWQDGKWTVNSTRTKP